MHIGIKGYTLDRAEAPPANQTPVTVAAIRTAAGAAAVAGASAAQTAVAAGS